MLVDFSFVRPDSPFGLWLGIGIRFFGSVWLLGSRHLGSIREPRCFRFGSVRIAFSYGSVQSITPKIT
ncbi:unnamed protein product [Arabidopsis halleri]